jgi:hypothetical protein
MANMLFANNAATTLASGITSSATSLTVAAGTGSIFPSPTGSQYFYCTLIDAATNSVIEIVQVTARSTDTFTIVRAQDGTSASAYLAGDKVELRLVRASLNDFPKLDESNTFSGATNTFANISATSFSGAGTGLTGTATSLSIGGNAATATSATSATSATTATNIASGAANQIHYQTAASTTGFITAPTTASTLLEWNGSSFVWAAAGGATGGGTDQIFNLNGQTVTTSYSIPSGKNAVTAGKITVNSGVTVTVPSGSRWVIV